MIRSLYLWLLRLHPRRFRERFQAEMLEMFDEAAGTLGAGRMLADAAGSLIRQRLVRSATPTRLAGSAAVAAASGVPAFRTLQSEALRPATLIPGAILSVLAFWAVVFATGHSRVSAWSLVGSGQNRAGVLPVSSSSTGASDRYTDVRVKPAADDLWRAFAEKYFKIFLVLDALDVNHDFVISAEEIANAPAALGKLDLDHDGKLTAEECGFRTGLENGHRFTEHGTPLDMLRPIVIPPEELERMHTWFMRLNPVNNALDADHDNEISPLEIRNAAAALRTLDLNGDGRLVPIEIAPDSEVKRILQKGGQGYFDTR